MPRKYIRKTVRRWDNITLLKALAAVKNKEMGWNKASKHFGIPQATLRRHAVKQKIAEEKRKNRKPRRHIKKEPACEIEQAMVDHIKLLETRLFGFTRCEVSKLAYKFAAMHNIPHTFDNELKLASPEWMAKFRYGNPDIKFRKPEWAVKSLPFNKSLVEFYFDTYQDVIRQNNIPSYRLYNVDEFTLSTDERHQKAYAIIARTQMGALKHEEMARHVTAICCTNATGHYIPPCLIFPRKLVEPELIVEGPAGTLGIAHEAGWVTPEVFHRWLMHFQDHVKASLEDKVLLIVNAHFGHKGVESWKFAEENGIMMICLPPNCEPHMRPLEPFFGSLKAHFKEELHQWFKDHPYKVATHFQVGSLLRKAFGRAGTMQSAIDGFQKTGLWPVNPNIFPDHLFELDDSNVSMRPDNSSSDEDIGDIECTPLINNIKQEMSSIHNPDFSEHMDSTMPLLVSINGPT